MKKRHGTGTADLRKLARGQDCQVRAPVCNFNSETTVLAHLPGGGMGMKHHDLHGAWACSSCHDYVDGRGQAAPAETRQFHLLVGVIRTQEQLIKLGVLV